MAMTQTTSRRVNPSSLVSPSFSPAGNIGCCTGAAFLSICTIGQNVVRSVLPRRAVDVELPPRVFRNHIAFQIRAAPTGDAARALHQCLETFRARRILSGIKRIEIEGARQAFDLNPCSLYFRFTEEVKNARADQGHDEGDDRYDHEHLDQCKSLFGKSPDRLLTARA